LRNLCGPQKSEYKTFWSILSLGIFSNQPGEFFGLICKKNNKRTGDVMRKNSLGKEDIASAKLTLDRYGRSAPF